MLQERWAALVCAVAVCLLACNDPPSEVSDASLEQDASLTGDAQLSDGGGASQDVDVGAQDGGVVDASSDAMLPVADALLPMQCGGMAAGQLFGPLPAASPAQRAVATVAGSVAGSTDGIGSAASFNRPDGVVVASDRMVYVTDCLNHTIRRIDPSNWSVTTFAGTAGQEGTADGTGAAARFNCPLAMTSTAGALWVADTFNHTLRRIDLATAAVTTTCGSGTEGWRDGACASAEFASPRGLTTDGTALFVSDSENHVIRRVDLGSAEVSTIAGAVGATGWVDGDCRTARFLQPRGLATDGISLFVADLGNAAVRRIDIATGNVETLAGRPSPPFAHEDGPGADARFFGLWHILTDGTNLFVSDVNNRVVRQITLSSGLVTTIAGNVGVSGSDDGTGAAATFQWPAGIGLMSDGSLVVADRFGQRVRQLTVP